MKKFILLSCFTVLLLILLTKLLLNLYSNQLLNSNGHNRSEFKATLTEDVLQQITNSSKDSSLLVVNIWESWCKPCIKEIPQLNLLSEDFQDYNIRFVAISSSSVKDCNKVLNAKGIEFKYETLYERKDLIRQIDSIYYDSATTKYPVPQNIIINNKGIIVLFLVGAKPENIVKMRLYLEENGELLK